jgi:uncharacterized protein
VPEGRSAPDVATVPDGAAAPFRQFVLKLHSRCDLACDHCYIYEHQDTSWRHRPPVASPEMLRAAAERIAEHARAHELTRVSVVLHGGEPLLAGPRRLREAAEALRGALAGTAELDLRMQTNGVRLDERFCDLFAAYDIKVGVSLDGDRHANDLHRRFRDGRSSHERVLRGLALLGGPRYRAQFAGLLCTVDLRADPLAVYDALRELNPPRIDFLLPHATWEHPPPRPSGAPAPYADWLLRVHDRWERQGRPMEVRMFESVESTLRGGPAATEALGLEPVDLLVIETDGSLEQADSLKTAFDGAPATGYDVFRHRLDEVAVHPGIAERQHGLDALAAQCRGCPVVDSCGGGLYAHRWRADGTGFANPSVYCADLLALISGIRERLTRPAAGPAEGDASMLTDDQFISLALGPADPGAMRALTAGQLAIGRQLLALTLDDAEADRADPVAEEAVRLLLTLDAEAPEALDAVLAHPYTRAWAVHCQDKGRADAAERTTGLAELAAAAVLRAGRPEPVRVPLREGVLRLPTLGRALLDPDAGTALVIPGPDGFRIEVPGSAPVRAGAGRSADRRWQPLHQVRAGRWSVALEDTDPYRDCHSWPVTGRLDELTRARWDRLLPAAWRMLDTTLPGYADGLALGLHTVTPLLPGRDGSEVSSAARHAFGAVGVALPGSEDPAQTLALLLVHEFQHVKLGALLDGEDLLRPGGLRPMRVPWRPDPRPPEAVLQGVYAHLAVVEFWRAREQVLAGGPGAVRARRELDRWQDPTAEAAEELAASGALTERGAAFLTAIRQALALGQGLG